MASIRDAREPIGFVVALREHGEWSLSWDGEVHRLLEDGKASAREASDDRGEDKGWETVVCRLVPIEDIRNPGRGDA